ncbi:hypothetical protein ACO0K4_19325, partial [Undibacterium sp. RuTC16W]
GIEQVNLAITQMDEMTQQNAALVEQAAAAAESMEEQAQALAQTVRVFKTSNVASAAPAVTTKRVEKKPEKKSSQVTKLKISAKPAPTSNQSSGKSSRSEKPDADWEEF